MTISPHKRPRVLAIAEAANPELASVPLVGWSMVTALRKVADVHLVTQVRNRDAILRGGLVEGQDFTAINSEAIAGPFWRLAKQIGVGDGKGWTMLQAINALTYPYFEHLVWKSFSPALKAGTFDIVHRLTPVSPTNTSPIARKLHQARVPFVLGPLNGGVPWPPNFEDARRAEREWLSYVRGAYKVLPGRKSTFRHAAAIIVGSRHTATEVPQRYRDKTIYIPENGIDPTRFTKTAAPKGPVLRACFVGRLVPYKGADMLIAAASDLLRSGRMILDIVGDGPMMDQLKAQAKTLDCTQGLTFHGWLPHTEVQNILCRSHILGFPSIREFGGGVVLEAMALGVVPVVVDYAGPSELVTPDVGFKLPCGDHAQIITAFKETLAHLAESPDRLAPFATNAKARVEADFLWSRKAAQISQIYSWVLNKQHIEKPRFFPDTTDF